MEPASKHDPVPEDQYNTRSTVVTADIAKPLLNAEPLFGINTP